MIGIFDSGLGGLTVFREIRRLMPQYDYLYLGDNARAPYGSRSFEIVYQFTLQAVQSLFNQGCPLVILACNTASAKALRTIQQLDLPRIDATKRVLGVIRPTVEAIDDLTTSKHIGILGTAGTVASNSYGIEIGRFHPHIHIESHACPMWVPLVENNEYLSEGADYFVQKEIEALLSKDDQIDCIVLGCTHYPMLMEKIRKYTPPHVTIFSQGQHIAQSLSNYLQRHPEMERRCSKGGITRFQTTDSPERFIASASQFLHEPVDHCEMVSLL